MTEKTRETRTAWLWRNRMPVALWGGSFLVLDLVWGAARAHASALPSPYGTLVLAASFLALVLWSYLLFARTDNAEYRRLLLAGKLATPQEAAAVEAVTLKPPKRHSPRDEMWDALDPREAARPDPGYPRRVRWLPRPLQGLGCFLLILLFLVIAVRAEYFIGWSIARLPDAIAIYVGNPFVAMIFASIAAGATGNRRHRKIRAQLGR